MWPNLELQLRLKSCKLDHKVGLFNHMEKLQTHVFHDPETKLEAQRVCGLVGALRVLGRCLERFWEGFVECLEVV